jgi:hypothetical protein
VESERSAGTSAWLLLVVQLDSLDRDGGRACLRSKGGPRVAVSSSSGGYRWCSPPSKRDGVETVGSILTGQHRDLRRAVGFRSDERHHHRRASRDPGAIEAALPRRACSGTRHTLKADGSLDDGVACTVNTGQALVQAGFHPATGGNGLLACSGDMLLQALVACAGVTMCAVATSLGLAISGTLHAEGTSTFAEPCRLIRRLRSASRRSG